MLEYQIKLKCPKAKEDQFIKMYKIYYDSKAEYEEKYIRDEAECQFIASQLNLSPKIYEYGQCGDNHDTLSYYIITELIPSRDLEEEIKIVNTSRKVRCTLSMYETLVHKFIPVIPLFKTLYYINRLR